MGLNIYGMNVIVLKKTEEHIVYIIELNKKIELPENQLPETTMI